MWEEWSSSSQIVLYELYTVADPMVFDIVQLRRVMVQYVNIVWYWMVYMSFLQNYYLHKYLRRKSYSITSCSLLVLIHIVLNFPCMWMDKRARWVFVGAGLLRQGFVSEPRIHLRLRSSSSNSNSNNNRVVVMVMRMGVVSWGKGKITIASNNNNNNYYSNLNI